MRRWIEVSAVVTLSWQAGCVTPPGEVETDAATSSAGSSSTTVVAESGTIEPGTSAPGDATAVASGSGGSTGGSSGGRDDSSTSEGGSSDSTGEPPDEPSGPFDTPVLVAELGSFAAEDDPTLTADMLEIYFGTTRDGLEDIWMSTRASVEDMWDPPVRVDALSSGATDTLVEVSPDGLFILLASDRLLFGDQDVYYAERDDRDQPWPTLQPLPGAANAGSNDWGVTPGPALTTALLCRAPLGQSDVYEAPADFTSWVVSDAAVVAELSSPQEDCSVSPSPDGREIFLETTRVATTFGWNLFVSTRPDPGVPWPAPVEVAELNTNFDEQDPWISPDRHTIYFASSRSGNLELYVATRP